jgi:sterol desaturase/sphingolipid hydroxylase (fatty acid hydroxylase superfamily)
MNAETKTKQKIKYTVHGIHHEYPKDKDRLAMPPLMSGMISVLLFFICWVSMGEYTFGFLSGLLLGYTSYLFVHYAVHAFSPPSNFLKILWVNHAIHHYKDEEKAFGVSSPLWDMVFGTLPSKKN